MPLYELIFLKESNFMSENSMEVINQYEDYYLSKEGTCLRMYGCSRPPSLLPKYATDYVVQKEVAR